MNLEIDKEIIKLTEQRDQAYDSGNNEQVRLLNRQLIKLIDKKRLEQC